jgi:hypothetical protein
MRFTTSPPCRWRLASLALALVVATPLGAQDDPRLRDALRIAQEGGSDSARALVGNLLRATQPTDSLYPQILFTMGLVSRSVVDMRQNYSRVAVEYTTSAWADDALFRLSLLDYAAGNLAGTSRQLDRLRNDYPESPLIASASEWAARALFDQRMPAEACRWLALGIERAGGDVELKNRLDYLNGRCLALPPVDATTTDSGPGPPPPAAPPPDTAARRTGFGVQVGAVNTQAAADRLAGSLKTAGFTPYVVQEGRLFKVRVGPYPDRGQATAAAEQIRRRLGHSPFVVKEP